MDEPRIEITFHTAVGPYSLTLTEDAAREYVGHGWSVSSETGGRRALKGDIELF